MKALRYWIEAGFAWLLYGALRLIPLRYASGFGGALARFAGPKTKVHRVALYNIERAMPELSEQAREQAIVRMWDNLGRNFCEYPHLNDAAMLKQVESVVGAEHLRAALDADKPVFIISGHLGNWELPPVVSASEGMKLHLLYRAANNPAVDHLIARIRSPYTLGLHDKGRRAARAIVSAIQHKEPVAMLVDQKSNNGIEVPFFGEMAMTNDAVAHLVMKHQPLVLPSRCIRLEGCRFRIEVEPPMQFTLTGDQAQDTQNIMQQVHALLERWIKEDPAQWFWVHKRWPHSKKAGRDD